MHDLFYAAFVNGLPLPNALLDLVEQKRWFRKFDRAFVQTLFPDEQELMFYSSSGMVFENQHWWNETNLVFIGESDLENLPGNIDPHQSVLIGDFGLGSDAPIALDYRGSRSHPSVLRLKWFPSPRKGEVKTRWIEVAPEITAFATSLGL